MSIEPIIAGVVSGVLGRIANELGAWSLRRKAGEKRRRYPLRIHIRFLVVNIFFYVLIWEIIDANAWHPERPHWITVPPWNLIGSLFGIMLIAAALFTLRTKHLSTYASIEFVAGAVTAWFAIAPLRVNGSLTLPQDPDRVLKIVAAIYLMVRSMDNSAKAAEQQASAEAAPKAQAA